jgi:amino acid adenylation domain-containing protein
MPFALRLDGPLDTGAIARSLNEIVRRHAILRTTFAIVDGQPVQLIAPALAVPLPQVDLGDLSEPARAARVQELSGAEFQHSFDLARGPLLRASLLRLGECEHTLLLNFHHVVFDGWSYDVLVSELATLYAAFATGRPSPLPELPVQYADFAAWQRERLQGALTERQLTYWRAQLGGELPRLTLLTDRPQQPASAQRGASQAIILPSQVTAGLLRLSRAEEATPFMTLLALFTLLLARQTGQEDIVVGSPIANRPHTDSEALIGFFLNTLVLRINLAGSPTFRELARRVRETALQAYAHQDVPFEKLVEQLQPDRDLERTPLFDVLFNYINTPQAHPTLPGLTLRLEDLDEQESKFPITLYATEQGDELRLLMVYQSALFSPERISGLLEQLSYLAEQIATAPDQPIGAYSLVTPAASAILPDPRADLPAPAHPPITAIIEELAACRPEHPAIAQRGRSWSYAELVQSARGIAEALVAQGLERGDVVAVSGPRSFGLIASMLAALMSGGKLLTLDQHLPHERRQVMLRAAGATYLLWADQRQPEAERDSSLITLHIDPNSGLSDATAHAGQSGVMLPQIRPEDPAYIFFTSGTTGVPKGVLGWHNGLSHFLTWQRETFAIGWQDRAAQLTGLSFDVVLRDVFTPLTAGATLCLPDDGDELGPEHVLPWLERERITMLHTVPALAQSWLANVPQGVTLGALRWAFFAGEPLRDTLVKRWRAAFPESGAIVNLYGPTETTLAKCFYQVPAEPAFGVQPVGRPLPHTQALVLSEGQRLCGVGEVGEIAIRTPFRSLGYSNAPEEQRKRFIKNPFRDDDRDLVYLTGDRGRYRRDGQLEILGRVDQQVKIRGVRIEPDEVAALLAQHPAVRACAVVAQQNERGEYALVAYIVEGSGIKGQGSADPASEILIPDPRSLTPDLRDYLARQLPSVMLPAAYVPLDALPLTPNGKLDRKALPPADLRQPATQASIVAPRTPLEEILAGVWAEVLGAQQVGAEDNFFDIGGHSLLASMVASRISQAFKIAFPVRALFEAPTVAQLARHMIAVEVRPGQTEKIAQVLKRIKSMSSEDRRQTLQQMKA